MASTQSFNRTQKIQCWRCFLFSFWPRLGQLNINMPYWKLHYSEVLHVTGYIENENQGENSKLGEVDGEERMTAHTRISIHTCG